MGVEASRKGENQGESRAQDKIQSAAIKNETVEESQLEKSTSDGTKNEEIQENSEGTTQNNSDRTVYSDHIFMIPLEMDAKFTLSSEWKKEFVDDKIISGKANERHIGKEFKRRYMLMRYFNEDAKQAILNIENKSTQTSRSKKASIVENYYFSPLRKLQEETGENGIYTIELERPTECNDENKDKEANTYKLEITNIRLRKYKDEDTERDLYLLMIYTENTTCPKLDDVKKINQYGRRIFTPWMPHATVIRNKDGANSDKYPIQGLTVDYTECAKSLSIRIGKNEFKQDKGLNYLDIWEGKYPTDRITKQEECKIKANLESFCISENECDSLFGEYITHPRTTSFISELLNFGKKDDRVEPKLITDDRMFVCYIIRDAGLVNDIQKFDEEKFQYAYEYDKDASDKLYSVIYVDNGSASCQSRTMRVELLKKAIYSRWIEWGTIHAITQHSFGCITTPGAPLASVIEPFLVEYVEMASIVLAQRAQLLRFSRRAGEESQGFQVENLQQLQKDYILFKNQFLLFEVTPQEQGYELYKKLQEELYVFEEKQELDNQLQSLYEYANVQQEQELNKIAGKLGWLGILLATLSVVWDRMKPFDEMEVLFSRHVILDQWGDVFYEFNWYIFLVFVFIPILFILISALRSVFKFCIDKCRRYIK